MELRNFAFSNLQKSQSVAEQTPFTNEVLFFLEAVGNQGKNRIVLGTSLFHNS